MYTNRHVADRVVRVILDARARLLDQRDRGDVPGWVLITLMTAGIVTLLWGVAGDLLKDLFTDAVNGVKGPGQ